MKVPGRGISKCRKGVCFPEIVEREREALECFKVLELDCPICQPLVTLNTLVQVERFHEDNIYTVF